MRAPTTKRRSSEAKPDDGHGVLEPDGAGTAAIPAIPGEQPANGAERQLAEAAVAPTLRVEPVDVADGEAAAVDRVAVPWTARVTWEHAAYALLLVAAALTRFWDLGGKALHHDESLHAYYSWGFFAGVDPYTHDPLMHGPFLFHANALAYFLFGASDATSRYVPALAGVILVGLPWFLRGPRLLGRWGALTASVLLLFSPAILYQSRYIRHDIYTVVGSLALFVAIVRYIERPQRRWLVIGAGTLSFLYANHEIVFAIALVFVLVVWGALLWGTLRPLVPLHVGAAALGVAMLVAVPRIWDEPFPEIPWGGDGAPQATRDNQLRFYGELLTWPLVVAALLLAAAVVVLAVLVLRMQRDPNAPGQGLVEGSLGGAPEGSVDRAVLAAWRDKIGLGAAIATFAGIFVVLYTTLVTNMEGLATGTVSTRGTLFYWLAQHDVQRGEQPWFYFLLLFPQYEFVAVLFGLAAAAVVLWRTVGPVRITRGTGTGVHVNRAWSAGPRQFTNLFLLAWFGFMFAVLSWAGEKMPWLVIHFALPATLLAASLIGELVERAPAALGAARNRVGTGRASVSGSWVAPAVGIALVLLAGGWFFLAGRLTYGGFSRGPDGAGWVRDVSGQALDDWWLLALPLIAAIALIGLAWWAVGPGRAARTGAFAALAVLLLLQVHAGWRLNYLDGDVPRDMIVYTQSSPDVTRVMAEIDHLSMELTGGKDLEVWYNSCASWPYQWYLRDYPNKRYFGNGISEAPPSNAAVVIANETECANIAQYMDGYTAQTYALRWWFPEDETYRKFAIAPEIEPWRSAWGSQDNPSDLPAIIGSIGDSLETQLTAEGQQRLYRLAMYRDLPGKIGSFTMTVYVRDDLVPRLNGIRY